MNLIILTSNDALDGNRFCVSDHRADHIRQVLKSNEGDSVTVGLLDGPQGSAVIEQITDEEIVLHAEALQIVEPPRPTIDFICALPRPQTLKKVLFTCGMMGVRRLDLIRANRVERSYYHSPLLQPERYTPHLLEGLSQGKFTRLPIVSIHERFKPFFEDVVPSRNQKTDEPVLRLMPDRDSAIALSSCVGPEDRRCTMCVAVGPEGGWVPFEIELMEAMGFQRFSLGPWVLRVEHAVTAALAQIQLACGAT